MEPWEYVRELCRSGHPEDALRVAREQLTQTPDAIQLRRQAQWACYYLIKDLVTQIHEAQKDNRHPNRVDLNQLYSYLKDFYRLKPELPGLATSMVLFQLARIGRDFEHFLPFVQWVGIDCLRTEDFVPKQKDGGGEFPSLVLNLARELAAWIKAMPDVKTEQVSFALEIAKRALAQAYDADKIWLEWDLAKLLRRTGALHEAATQIVSILKRKRTEYWVWAEAARTYRDEQSELSLACYCQALRLGADPKYLGKVHIELAALLAEDGNTGQASREVVLALEVYDREGWSHPKELAAQLRSDWYDPTQEVLEPAAFYAEHADEALTLCFDAVHEHAASFLGMTEPREGKKPRPRFAVKFGKRVLSILGRGSGKSLKGSAPGSPVTLLIGTEGERREVLEVTSRPDGTSWDCLEQHTGVITYRPNEGDRFKVYCSRNLDAWVPLSAWSESTAPVLGKGVCFWGATNAKNDRFEVSRAEPTHVSVSEDIDCFYGPLRRSEKGYGFVDNVYVPQELVETVPPDATECTVVAIQSFDKTKNKYSWRAVAIEPG
jgi:hypothetical protein